MKHQKSKNKTFINSDFQKFYFRDFCLTVSHLLLFTSSVEDTFAGGINVPLGDLDTEDNYINISSVGGNLNLVLTHSSVFIFVSGTVVTARQY